MAGGLLVEGNARVTHGVASLVAAGPEASGRLFQAVCKGSGPTEAQAAVRCGARVAPCVCLQC